MPVGLSTRRMRSLWESATIRSPSGAIATPSGVSSCASVASPSSPEKPVPRSLLPATVVMIVFPRVDAPDDVVVRVGEIDVAVRRDDDAARRVEPGLHRRPVVAGVPFLRADHLPVAASRSMKVLGAEREDHHDEDDGAAQPVHPEQRRREERRARRPGLHRHHALAERHLIDAAADRSPSPARCATAAKAKAMSSQQGGRGSRQRAGQRPPRRDVGADRGEQRRAQHHRRHDAERRRAQVRADAQQPLPPP